MSLVITGNPGVGKHTIVNKITTKLNSEIIDINKIALESNFYEKNNGVIDVDVKKIKRHFKKKILKNSIIVGHLAPYVLSKNQVSKVIILRKSPYKLNLIYKKRKYSKKKTIANIDSEILGIIAHDSIKEFGKTKCIQIDTTNKTIQKTVQDVMKAIKGKKRSDYVDWLSLIAEKDHFKKFFSY